MTTDLQDQYEKLSNQARFIQMFIDGDLKISGRKTSVIVDDLVRLKFRPFRTTKAARAAGEDEAALDDDDNEGSALASDYDYLLGMAIRSLTRERVRPAVLSACLESRR
jgi:DNA topoisomerase-2